MKRAARSDPFFQAQKKPLPRKGKTTCRLHLRVNSALLNRKSNPIDRQHVSRDAVVHVVSFGIANHIVETIPQDGLQLLVDDGLFPEVALAVLHPFKVTGRDSTGVGQDVGHDEHALLSQNLIGYGSSGAVGAFDDDASLDAISIAAG